MTPGSKTSMTLPRRIPTLLALLAALTPWAPAPAPAQTPDDPRARLLVTPEWLASHQADADLVLLHVGPDDEYAEEHIPGARHVSLRDLAVFRTLDDAGGARIPLELPSADDLRRALEGLGLSDDSRVVVYFAEGWVTPAARVVFTLDHMGLGTRTAFLDGGLDAWKAAGGTVTPDATAATSGRLTLEPPNPELVVDHAFVEHLAAGHGPAGHALVDARSGANYDGVEEDHGKRGHIAGAGSLPWPELIDEELRLRPPEELRKLFTRAGVEPGDTVVGYCHIGQYATLVLLAARTLGHPVRLFDGSMHEWAARDLPVTTEP